MSAPTKIRFAGEVRSIRGWEAHLGFAIGTIAKRLRIGWPIFEAMRMPVGYVRHPQRCTECDQGGHNARTCGRAS